MDKKPPTPALDKFLANLQEQILNPLITLVALAAFVLFAFGVVEFIMGAENEEKRSTGKRHMLWGVIGLAIVFGAQIIKNLIDSSAKGLFGTG